MSLAVNYPGQAYLGEAFPQSIPVTGTTTTVTRVTGEASTSNASDVRVIGQISTSVTQDVAIQGQITTSLSSDVRAFGTSSATSSADVRLTAQATLSGIVSVNLFGAIGASSPGIGVGVQAIGKQYPKLIWVDGNPAIELYKNWYTEI